MEEVLEPHGLIKAQALQCGLIEDQDRAAMAKVTVGEQGAEYPYLAEVVVELGKRGYDYTEEFDFGLGFILDGLERFLGL